MLQKAWSLGNVTGFPRQVCRSGYSMLDQMAAGSPWEVAWWCPKDSSLPASDTS